MADVDNPFQAFDDPNNPKTADHRELLGQTQPWLIVFGAFLALGALGIVLATGTMALFGVVGMAGLLGGEAPEGAALGGGFMLGLVVVYGLIGLLYGALAYFLIRQAVAISSFRRTAALDDLADVLRAHRDFWRVSGISMVVFMVLYCGGIGTFVLLGSAMSSTFEP